MVKDEVVSKDEKVVKKEYWGVGQVATQTQPVIVKGEEKLDSFEALARIMNDLDELKGLLG